MIVEFVGGPCCGETREMPNRPLELYFALLAPDSLQQGGILDPPLRVSTYRLKSWDADSAVYDWAGEL